MKTLIVGLDAACWPYLDPLLQSGQMPALQRLMDGGAWGTLRSTVPPWTPAAWASIVTGKNPGKHGIFDMMWRRPGTYEFTPTSARVRNGTPFWQRLNKCGVRVGLVNIPFTYPAETVEGFVVCGFGTPDDASDFVQPQELASSPLFANFQPTVPTEFLRSAPATDVLEMEKRHQSRQVEIAIEGAARYQVDVLAINLMLTDHANHKMPEMVQVHEAYRHADADLDALLRSFRPDNVMLISDHGSSRVQGDFLLNVWLRDQGYVVSAPRTPDEQADTFNWVLAQYLRGARGWNGPAEKAVRRLLRHIVPRLPAALQNNFWQKVEAVLPRSRDYVRFSTEPDPRRTLVFPGSSYSGLLYLNVAGREPEGVLPPSERAALIAELSAKLAAIVEPESGQPLFSNVYRAEDIYDGAATPHAPDIILDAYDVPWNIRTRNAKPVLSQIRNGYFVDTVHGRDYGWHSKEGVFLFCGKAFLKGARALDMHLMDVPATLLHLYDVPIPSDYDGRVVKEVLAEPFAAKTVHAQPGDAPQPAMNQTTDFSDAEADSLMQHLQALGYLE